MNERTHTVWLPELHWVPVHVIAKTNDEALDKAFQMYHNSDEERGNGLGVDYSRADVPMLYDGCDGDNQPYVEPNKFASPG